MKPYGMNINNSPKTHSHNKCPICRAYAPTKGQARLTNKGLLKEELDLYLGSDWDKEGEGILDIFLESGFYGEVDPFYVKYG